MMKLFRPFLLTTLSALIVGSSLLNDVQAQGVTAMNTRFYYEIGGGQAISGTQQESIELNTSIYAGVNYSCGEFDFDENVKQLFDNYQDMLEDLYTKLLQAISGAVASLPAYLLQRANPGLYEVLTNAIARYEQLVQISIRSCKEMEAMVARGENPYDDWIKVAKGEAWQQGGEEGKTATETEEDIEEEARRNGVLWRGGERCGGEGMERCHVIEDVVREGYERLITGAGEESSIVRYFPSEDDAVDWSRIVLGSYSQSLAEGGAPETVAGQGLSVLIYEVEQAHKELLTAMVESRALRTIENYEIVSAPGVDFNTVILSSLEALPEGDRLFAVDRLASETAAAQILDRALVLRRLIRAGVREAHIANTTASNYIADMVLPELNEEIESILLEKRVKDEFVSETVAKLLDRLDDEKSNDISRPGTRSPSNPLIRGVPTNVSSE